MWLNDLRVVLPDQVLEHGSIRIEDGVIAEICAGCAPDSAPSLNGLVAIPGIIDLHGDMLERDVEPRPGARFPIELGLYELDKRLAACGITTAYAAISFAWGRDDIRSQENAIAMIETVNALRDSLLVDFKVHARFEVTNPQTAPILARLLEAGQVDLVSIMDHTPGQGQYKDVDNFFSFMQRWLGVDLDTIETGLHEKFLTQVKAKVRQQAQKPRDWDVVRDVLTLARQHRIPVASHDDDTAAKVSEQAALGVTISEFPVTLEAAQAAHACGLAIIMGAPNAYRKQSTSNNLSAFDAIKAGLVDILATDYYPAAPLHAAFRLADEGVMPLHQSVKLISQNAAAAMGLHDRGRIAPGSSADLVLVENDGFHRVRGTIRRGVPIFWDSHLAKLAQVSALLKV